MSGTIVEEKVALFSTEIGIVQNKVTVIRNYDVEDFVSRKSRSQGRVLQLLNTGNNIDINTPKGPRTLATPYMKNNVTLPGDD